MNGRQNLKCLLLDDELPSLAYLRVILEQIPHITVVKAFNDPFKFLQESNLLTFDFCILDIEMPGLNGLEVARSLQGKPVIFTTAYKEYAADAYDIEAIDYVRKPIIKDRIEKAVFKVRQRLQDETSLEVLTFNTSRGKALVYPKQIVYITVSEIDKRDKLAILENTDSLTVKNVTFNFLLAKLPNKLFCQVNKKEIIAIRRVSFYTHNQVTISFPNATGEEKRNFQLSESYKQSFLDAMRQ